MRSLRFYLQCLFILLAGSDVARSDDELILFTYRGRTYTAADLTSVDSASRQSVNQQMDAEYSPQGFQFPRYWFSPAVEAFPQGAAFTSWNQHYEHCLNGVIEAFVMVEASRRLQETTPLEPQLSYSREKLEAALLRKCELSERLRKSYVAALAARITHEQFVREPTEEFPQIRFRKTPDGNWPIDKPLIQHVNNGFPCLQDGVPAIWMRAEIENAAARFHIESEIERNRPHFISLLENEIGQIRCIHASNCGDEVTQSFPALASLLSADANRLGMQIRRCNQLLEALGSPSRLDVVVGPKSYYTKFFGVSASALKQEQCTKVVDPNGDQGLLFRPQSLVHPDFASQSAEPFSSRWGRKQWLARLFEASSGT